MSETKIYAHPDTPLPAGWRHGAHTSGEGWSGYHVLHEGGASAILVERPDYDADAETLAEALHTISAEVLRPRIERLSGESVWRAYELALVSRCPPLVDEALAALEAAGESVDHGQYYRSWYEASRRSGGGYAPEDARADLEAAL